MRVLLPLVLVLLGCADPSASEGAADMALPGGDGPGSALNVEGRIVDLERQPLPGMQVSLCQGTCRDTVTGPQGEFFFPAMAPSFYTLRARNTGAAESAELVFPVYLQGIESQRLGPLVLPRVGAGTAVGMGVNTLAIDGALTLTMNGGDLSLPAGGPVTRLGGVRIPQALWPNFCVPSARVLAMWAFSPTGVSSSSPIAVTVSESLGLAKGTRVSLIEISPQDGRPAVTSFGVVSEDAKIQTEMGAGVRRLTWLLLAVLQGGA